MAIQLMRKCTEIAEGCEGNIRTIILSCLLTAYFEFIFDGYPRREVLYSQIIHGVRLLEDWSRKQRKGATMKEGLSSPAPNIFEDDLYQALLSLDIKMMYVTGLD